MPDNVFTARVSFTQLAQFSLRYMLDHSNNLGLVPLPELVFLLEDTAEIIKAGLVDEAGWVDPGLMHQPLHEQTIWDNGYGNWLAYGDDVPFDFMWESCSGAVLIARPLPWPIGEPERMYMLECRPPNNRVECGYMDIFRRLGVQFECVPPPGQAPWWHSQDEEPNWCPIDLRTDRPLSLC